MADSEAKPRSRSRSPPRGPATDSEAHRERSRSPRRPTTDRAEKCRLRTRSKSPMREVSDKKQDFSKAFKYKSKDKKQDGERGSEEKSYRQRDDSYRPSRYGGGDKNRGEDRNRRDEGDSRVADKFGNGVKDKFGGGGGGGASSKKSTDKFGNAAPRREDKPKPLPAPTGPLTFILVTVNDRLGTKATVPCLASDTVGDFKKVVAAHIGRKPHEIMLKRQGERPFKDFITLADYGVGSGVQLDLELDTGE